MIFIGTDIVLVTRIIKNIETKKERFLNHIFTENEQEICNNKVISAIHYAGKFAAKEAVKKAALSSKLLHQCSLKDIEILNDETGAPIVICKHESLVLGDYKISISHTGDYATATALLIIN